MCHQQLNEWIKRCAVNKGDNLASDDSADGNSEEDMHANDVTEDQFHILFKNSDDDVSDFEGFQYDTLVHSKFYKLIQH